MAPTKTLPGATVAVRPRLDLGPERYDLHLAVPDASIDRGAAGVVLRVPLTLLDLRGLREQIAEAIAAALPPLATEAEDVRATRPDAVVQLLHGTARRVMARVVLDGHFEVYCCKKSTVGVVPAEDPARPDAGKLGPRDVYVVRATPSPFIPCAAQTEIEAWRWMLSQMAWHIRTFGRSGDTAPDVIVAALKSAGLELVPAARFEIDIAACRWDHEAT